MNLFQGDNTMNQMGLELFRVLGLYLVLPLVLISVLLRYVLKLEGAAFKISFAFAALLCVCFMVYIGFKN